ncbi:MAG: selenide, water dikinase SelD [Pseudomonadota bacterium]
MKHPHHVAHDLVLVGGGHAHVEVLRQFAMHRPEGVRLTLISQDIETPYAGMLPGYLAGHYQFEDCHVDLSPLAMAAGARLYHSSADGLDLSAGRVLCADRPSVAFDTVSFDIGSTPARATIEGHEQALAIKPVRGFLDQWHRVEPDLLALGRDIELAVVGGGTGGVEVALCLHQRLSAAMEAAQIPHRVNIHIVTDKAEILTNHSAVVRRCLYAALRRKDIRVHTGQSVERISPDAVHAQDGFRLGADATVIATQASAPGWLRDSGLALDDAGFIRVNSRLQSVSDPRVFAAGDVASFDPPLAKNGVYAVRQGPVLAETLRAVQADTSPVAFSPQKRTLALISTGDRNAIASYGPLAVEGAWVWRMKDWIDQRWMDKYRVSNMDDTSEMSPMRCGGCGAKVPADTLSQVLSEFQNDTDDDILIGLADPDDAAVIRPPSGQVAVQTVDHFKTFLDDPYLLGRIATTHALSDIYAMGADPSTALALVTLPYATETALAEDLRQVLMGARETLRAADVRLVGGHTGEGQDMSFGLSVTGYADEDRLMKKTRLREGDALILTKPLGTGALLAGWMQGRVRNDNLQAAIASMLVSNREAARIFEAHGASACTDVTGFGLIGHLGEMVAASGAHAVIEPQRVPVLPGAAALLRDGIQSTLHPDNRAIAGRYIGGNSDTEGTDILFDPQTSGGLLGAVPSPSVDAVMTELK